MRTELLVYDGMDLMDFGGPFEVLLTADRLRQRNGAEPVFQPRIVSCDSQPVTSYGGAVLTPHSAPSARPEVLVVPGAVDIDAALDDTRLRDAIVAAAAEAEIVASVCTGAFLLSQAGLLDGRPWTTHWEDLAALSAQIPGGRRSRVVDAGPVITGGGISSGIDVGLHLVARLADPALARLCARQMDYDWDAFAAGDGGRDPVITEAVVPADPATVYRMWTTESGVERFLGVDSVIDARIGGRYEFAFRHDAPDGSRGSEGCRILALEPQRMVVFSWNSPPGMATRGIHTWVVLTLQPADAGTRVRLAHWGHGQGPDWDANRQYFSSAWPRVLDRLADAVTR